MTDIELMEKLKSFLGDKIVEMSNPGLRRVFMKVDPRNLAAVAVSLKKDLGLWYIAAISGVDVEDSFEILYHFGHDNGSLSVRTRIPKADPHIESISPIVPGAIFYERELQDMFGIIVDHIPDPRPLVVPDDWPAGNYPLRKDWKYERPPEIIPGGKQ
ncbi:MAG: NADH-quinone oxidoreductase subunit C [Candidatus Aminicenantes bacterium]|jgi:NADH-quinone oxidoreductase subunit C|nr:NADH-quinone oxidoreductase subunit C [Candidatus Aminicenantes bacterium]